MLLALYPPARYFNTILKRSWRAKLFLATDSRQNLSLHELWHSPSSDLRLGRFRGTGVIAFEAVAILDCGRTNTAANGNLAGEILRSLSNGSGLGTQAK